MRGRYKLLRTARSSSAEMHAWSAEIPATAGGSPHRLSPEVEDAMACKQSSATAKWGYACLFDLESDPSETNNLLLPPLQPWVKTLADDLAQLANSITDEAVAFTVEECGLSGYDANAVYDSICHNEYLAARHGSQQGAPLSRPRL